MTYDAKANHIPGYMSPVDLEFLYKMGRDYRTVAEIGSWKGRSTHALLSGGAHVYAIDTWLGSDNDETGTIAKDEDVYAAFCENTKPFDKLSIFRMASQQAVNHFADRFFDVVFIDAHHGHAEVKADILAWMPKAAHILCGHDYGGGWDTVTTAVNEVFGKPHGVADAIWWVHTTGLWENA
jgi:hypothetical protein